jgi:hypothetical protein
VGDEFRVYSSSVDVFNGSHFPKGSGLSLDAIFAKRPRPVKSIADTREKIGQGKRQQLVDF